MVNVTKDNFIQQTNDFLKHLPNASFIAIDEEMTGISIPGTPRPRKDHSPSRQYSTLKKVPECFTMMQLGVSLFFENDEEGSVDEWQSRRYNFYCYPGNDHQIVMNPSSIAFLQQHGLSLDLWTKQGISNEREAEALDTIEKYHTQKEEKRAGRKVQLTRAADVDFHARTMAALREWLDQANPEDFPVPEGVATLLPSCNSFLRRALYETIASEYPSLETESAPNGQILVVRLNDAERRARSERKFRERWEGLILQVGMWRVFDAISRVCRGGTIDLNSVLYAPSAESVRLDSEELQGSGRQIPLVVHNGFMDLAFLMATFCDCKLPDTLFECKQLIRSYFPIVYDTKVLATEHVLEWVNENSGLAPLFGRCNENVELLAPAGGAEASQDQEHEAAYDAWMTGCVYIGISKKLGEETTPGANKLYQMSMYTMDLEQLDDPLSRGMLPETTFRVAGIDPSVSTRDIVRCLANLQDADNRRVNFEVIWLDDTSFLVATSFPEDTDVLHIHADLIHQALKQRFSKERIITLKQVLAESRARPGWLSRLWNWIPGKRGTTDGDDGSERPAKRMRTL